VPEWAAGVGGDPPEEGRWKRWKERGEYSPLSSQV